MSVMPVGKDKHNIEPTFRAAGCAVRRRLRQGIMAGAVLVVSGCAVPDSLNPFGLFGEDTAEAETAAGAEVRARADAAEAAADDAAYPALSSVPDRPALSAPSVRQRVVEGLIADRENARYTDDAPRVVPASKPEAAAPLEPGSVAVSPAGGPRPSQLDQPAQTAPAADTVVERPPVPPRPGSGDGSLLAADPQVASRPTPAVTGAPAPPLDAPLATIQFADGSTNLDQRDIAILQQVADISNQTGVPVRVVGHASGGANTPAAQRANQDVSVARARAVANALIALGVPRQMLSFEGRSDLVPLFDEATAAGVAGNRRAEVYLGL